MTAFFRIAWVLLLAACMSPGIAAASVGGLCRRDCNDTQRECKAAVRAELVALQALCPGEGAARRQCRHDARVAAEPHRDECGTTGRACRACCKGVCATTTSSSTTTTSTSSSTTSTTDDRCGNGVVDPGETCDGSASPNGCFTEEPSCSNDCTACRSPLPCSQLVLTTTSGTTDCGFPAVAVPAVSPFSGVLRDADGETLPGGALGLGCLYLGAGLASIVPPARLPEGEAMVFDVVDECRERFSQLAPADTGDPRNCTVGPSETRHCANGHPGTDGDGACGDDVDCMPLCLVGKCVNGSPGTDGAGTCADESSCGASGIGMQPNLCEADPRCFFGPPIPAPNGGTSVCIVPSIADGVRGSTDMQTGGLSLDLPLRTRLYLTGLEEPFQTGPACPICSDGLCNAGPRAGQACTAATPDGTTIDCPPPGYLYLSAIDMPFRLLNTSEFTVQTNIPTFCESTHAGAFGVSGVREVVYTGKSAAGGFETTPRPVEMGAAACVEPSGYLLVDSAFDFPGLAAMSLSATVELR